MSNRVPSVVIEVRCHDEGLEERLRERLRARGLSTTPPSASRGGALPDPESGCWVLFEWPLDSGSDALDAVLRFTRKGGVAIALLPAEANASIACRLADAGVAEMISLPENAENIAGRVADRLERLHGGVRLLGLPPEGIIMDDLVRDLLDQALDRCQGNKSRAAKLLGIHRDQVRYWVKKYGLSQWVRTRSATGKIVPAKVPAGSGH